MFAGDSLSFCWPQEYTKQTTYASLNHQQPPNYHPVRGAFYSSARPRLMCEPRGPQSDAMRWATSSIPNDDDERHIICIYWCKDQERFSFMPGQANRAIAVPDRAHRLLAHHCVWRLFGWWTPSLVWARARRRMKWRESSTQFRLISLHIYVCGGKVDRFCTAVWQETRV